MWYEIVPGLAIICGCVTLVGLGTISLQKLQHDGKERRRAPTRFDYAMIKRDEKLAGKYWKSLGLESLAGVDPKKL